MLLSEKTSARAARNPLPPKLAALVREFRWFALLGLALYLALILYTYDRADPGWSHGVSDMGSGATGSHTHLVNFDTRTVLPRPGARYPVFNDTGTFSGGCNLVCHGVDHEQNASYP